MSEPRTRFYRTTIEVITPYDPGDMEAEVLAREGTSGSGYITKQETNELTPSEVEAVSGEFFWDELYPDDEEE